MSKKREAIVDAAMDENLLFLDGYDKCIIGLGGRINCGPVVVYDGDAIVKILAKDMTLDEAEEFYSFVTLADDPDTKKGTEVVAE